MINNLSRGILLESRENNNETYKSSKDSPFVFEPIDADIKDDAFHGSNYPRYTEWWYFDSILDNGYSAQMSVRVLSIIKNRFIPVFQRLDLYKDGELIHHNKKRYSFKKFEKSKELPSVKLDGKQVIKGYINKEGKLVYDLSFDVKNTSADLKFVSLTKGWMGNNPGRDMWAVLLPRAKVTGTLKIDGDEIKVKGHGYHDHNWDVRYAAAKNNLGWFWGKINFNNFTTIWATIFKTRSIGQPILVVNEIEGNYYNIKPKDITFIGSNLKNDSGKNIPYTFKLKAKTNEVDLDIDMNVTKTHHDKIMLRYHYWRYHVHCTGHIKIKNKMEKVDKLQIAEFLNFR